MEILTSFKNSVQLPKSSALFRLNRISMRNTLVYIITLSLILFIVSVIRTLSSPAGYLEGVPESMYLLQFFAVYPFVIIFMLIIGISMLTAVAFILKQLLKRKLTYAYLWKMTAFSLTIPLIVFTVISLFELDNSLLLIIPFLYQVFLMYRIILIYPQKKN